MSTFAGFGGGRHGLRYGQRVVAGGAPPAAVAVNDPIGNVFEQTTTVIDVLATDNLQGVARASCAVEVLTQPASGSATVRGDKDIDLLTANVAVDTAMSFTYRVDNGNGWSNTATVSFTVLASAPSAGMGDFYGQIAATTVGNVIAAWRFGDASGATMTDYSGNGHNGTYGGTPLYGRQALAFGSDKTAIRTNASGYGTKADAAALRPGVGAFSVFFQAHSLAGQVTVAQKGTNFAITVEATGRITLAWRGQQIQTSPNYAETGVRNHAMVCFDATDVRFYVDGFLVGGLVEGTGLTGLTSPWEFGRSTGGLVRDCTIHEAILFGTAKKTFAHAVELAEGQRGLAYRAALRTVNCATAGALTTALAAAIPGDHIVLTTNGTYAANFTLNANGTNKNQIVVRAATTGGPRIDGQFTLAGDWGVLEGVDFTGGQDRPSIQGDRCRVSRCTNHLFTLYGVNVNVSRFARVDHCSLTEPNLNSGGVASDNQPVKISVGATPDPVAMHWMVSHTHITHPGADLGNGRDGIQVGPSRNRSSAETYGYAYKVLIEDFDSDEVISLKSSNCFIWYSTFRASATYTQDRHGDSHEWRSCYWTGLEHNSFGTNHRFIGNSYVGGAADLLLGPGDVTQAVFEVTDDTGSRPACRNALIAGCTFSGGAQVLAGSPAWATGVDAQDCVAEGNIGWAVTIGANYNGALPNAATTDEWFETAFQLSVTQVGIAAVDDLVPSYLD